MSGEPVEKLLDYPGCEGHALQVFINEDDSYSGYCYALGKYISDPYHDKSEGYKPKRVRKTHKEKQEEVDAIGEYGSQKLNDRHLTKSSLDYFNIKVGVSEADGVTPTILYFPREDKGGVVGYNVKLINPKKFWAIGRTVDTSPFGWEQAKAAGGIKLFITEGELDAVALRQMLKKKQKGTKWESQEIAVISLNNGASSSAKFLSKWKNEFYKFFKKIVIVFDMDEAGRKSAKEAQLVLPDALVAELPMKDANECLLKKRTKGFCEAVLFNAVKPKNTRIVRGSSLRESAMKRPEMGLSYPWKKLTAITRGRRRGETLYWGAGVKMGKSEMVNALAVHMITHHKTPVFMCKPEEAMPKTYKLLVGKAAGRIFHDPNIPFDQEAWDIAEPLIGDMALILDVYQFVGWDSLKDDIRYAVTSEGVKDVIIDPITALSHNISSSDTNDFLDEMTAELSSMAMDLDFTADIFCHLKAPSSGDPHERGGKVLSTQFAGSRAMMRSANYFFGLQGNKDPDLELEDRNLRDIVVLEDREFGSTGIIPLYWDYTTGLFNEL